MLKIFLYSFLNGLELEQDVSSVDALRAKRLYQIYVLVEFLLLIIMFSRIVVGNYVFAAVIAISIFVLLGLALLIRKTKLNLAANILCSFSLIFCLGVMWTYDGIRDEAAIAIPSILMFSAILGGKHLYKILCLITVINSLGLGYVNSAEIYINIVSAGLLDSAITISATISLLAIAAWILAQDLRQVSSKLFNEHHHLLRSQQEIEKLAYLDQLTGLSNRAASNTLFDKAVSASKENAIPVYVMYVDLDNFKNINNTYSKKFGDQYLIEISHRLQNIITIDDFLCRMNGDEFLLIFNSLLSNNDANIIANEIQELIKNPFFKDGQIVSLTTSIGIASYPKDGYNFDSVMKNADIAMYYAKQNGRDGFHLYNKEINEEFFDPLSLISDMRTAIDKNQFYLTYQPKILLSDNTVVGAEALLRWKHPIHGLISPEIFIPIAEKSGLIIEIGNWVINQSCIACNNWKEAGFPDISVAINISTIQFNDKNIVERIKENIRNTGVNPANIELEITESLLLTDSSDFRNTLDKIKKLGIKVSIDDFGTGYSNLEYLKTIDVDILKIDRSFILNLKNENHNENIIKAIIQISNSLNIKVIAEGIETEESVNLLRAIGCQIGQGYFWAKPIIEEKFLAFLSNSKTGILVE